MPSYLISNPSAIAARRYLDINSKELTRAQNQLSSGLLTYDPSELPAASAIGIQFAADLQVINQASSNATQASALMQLAAGTLQGSNEILTRMSVLAAQSNSDSVGVTERKMFDLEYQALMAQLDLNAEVEWRGTSLFTKGDGTAEKNLATGSGNRSVAANDSSAGLTIAGSGNIAGFLEVTGAVSGAVSDVVIADGAGNSYITIGDTNFVSSANLGDNLAAGSFITFVNANDTTQKVVFKTGTDDLGTGNTATLDTDITAAFNGFTMEQNVTGLTSVPSWFSGGLDLAQTSGLYDGAATFASVQVTAGGNYDVKVTIGDQVFRSDTALTNAPEASGALTLTSTSNTSNKIVLNFDNNTAPTFSSTVNDLNGRASEYQSALRTMLGITSSSAAAATFTSRSVAAMPGLSVSVDDGLATGTYGLDYTASSGTFKLSTPDGKSFSKTIGSESISDDSVITFGNGLKLNITSTADFNVDNDKGFTTVNYDGVSMSFQTGLRASDTVGVSFTAATSSALNIKNSNVLTKTAASDAGANIKTAIENLNLKIAGLGSKKSQLEQVIHNLSITNQNLSAAKATFTDTDVPASLQSAQRYQALVDVSSSVFQQTIARESQLARMIQSAFR